MPAYAFLFELWLSPLVDHNHKGTSLRWRAYTLTATLLSHNTKYFPPHPPPQNTAMGNVASDCLSVSKAGSPTTSKPQTSTKKKHQTKSSDATLLTAPTLLSGTSTPNRLLKGSSLCSEESREPVSEATITVEVREMAGSWSLDDAPPMVAAQLTRIRRQEQHLLATPNKK